MATLNSVIEEIKVQARDLAAKVQSLIHEGNIRRIIIKDDRGHTYLEIPVNIALIGTLAAPIVAAVGAVAAFAAHFTIVVEKTERPGSEAAGGADSPHSETSGMGATESQMNMQGTVPSRVDNRGSSVDDLAGTGKTDAPGG